MNLSSHNEFLYASIEDTQQTIRAIDIKAEVLLLGMAIPLADAQGLVAGTSGLLAQTSGYIHMLVLMLAAIIVPLWVASFFFTLRVLQAVKLPHDLFPHTGGATGTFFAAGLYRLKALDVLLDRRVKPCKRLRIEKLDSPVDEQRVRAELTCQQLKVGYICARKIAMFNWSVASLMIGVGTSFVLWLVHFGI